jgi:hypothetical protein
MSQIKEGGRLSSLQLELLKVYALEPGQREMEDIQRMLGQYFGKKLADKVAQQVEKKGVSEEEVDQWLNEEA